MKNEIDKIKDRIVDRLTIIFGVFAIFAVGGSLFRWFVIGWNNIYLLHLILLLCVLTVTIMRKKITTQFKLHFLCIILLMISISGLFVYAHYSSWFFSFLAIAIMAILNNKKVAFVYSGVFSLFYLIIATGYLTNIFHTQIDPNEYSNTLSAWLSWFIAFSAFVVLIIEGFGLFYQELVANINEKIAINNELDRSIERLQSLSDNLPNGFVYQFLMNTKTNERKFTYLSAGIMNAHGLEPNDVYEDANIINKQIVKEDIQTVIDAENLAAKNMTTFNLIVCYRLPSGERGYRLLNSKPKKISEDEILWNGVSLDVSERKKNEIALKESEIRFKTLHNASFGGIAIHDNGTIMDCNLGLSEVTGYTVDELTGMDGLLLIAKKWRDKVKENITTGNEESYEALGVRKNGEEYPIRLEARHIPYKGKTVRVVEFKDITVHKKNIQQIKKLSTAVMQSSNTILISNTDGNIEYVNPAFTKISGYTAEEVIGQNPRVLSSNIQPEEYYVDMWNTITKGESWKGEFCNKTKYGKLFWENVTITAIKDDNGKIINYLAIKEDITDQKQAEQALQKSENLLKESQKIARIGTYSTDLLRGIWECTTVMDEIFGIDKKYKKDIAQWLQIVHPKDQEMMQEYLQINVLTNKENFNKEYRIIRINDQQERWVHGMGKLELNANGDPIKMIGTIQDITERKKVEGKLADQNTELTIAKEKAEESDRLKSAFLANISHEIRTPMNGILGFAEMLKRPDLQLEEKEEFFGIIQESGNRLLGLIDDLLDISKIESGQMQVSHSATNINELIQYIYSFFKPEVDNKGIQLSFYNSLPEKESIIKTDKEKIHIIFTNLVKNSIKYSNEGSIEIGYEKKDKYLEFFIKDTGIGIKPGHLGIIFERFRQSSESQNRDYEGVGLGLPITKAYVELLGGRIWLESEVGKGSVFYFTLPYSTIMEEKTAFDNVD